MLSYKTLAFIVKQGISTWNLQYYSHRYSTRWICRVCHQRTRSLKRGSSKPAKEQVAPILKHIKSAKHQANVTLLRLANISVRHYQPPNKKENLSGN